MSYYGIDPMDIDPDTGRPYSNYSSPSLDTSFHDGEMAVDDAEIADFQDRLARMVEFDPEYQAEEAAEILNELIRDAKRIKAKGCEA
jgi:hypothetical protein